MRFSIIIPVYNVEQYLPSCIDSILRQSCTDFELILVDDGSKDKSAQICDEFAKRDKRIQVIHQENAGVSHARNMGLDAAKGDYVLFVDSDDALPENALDVYVKALKDSPSADLIVAGMRKIFEGFSRKDDFFLLEDKDFGKDELEVFAAYLQDKYLFGLVCSRLYKSEIIKFHHIRFDESLWSYEDQLFFWEAITHCHTAKTLSAITYIYRRMGNESLCGRYIPSSQRIKTAELLFVAAQGVYRSDKYKNRPYRDFVNQLYMGIRDMYEPSNYKTLSCPERISGIKNSIKAAKQKGVYQSFANRLKRDKFYPMMPCWIDLVGRMKCLKYKLQK